MNKTILIVSLIVLLLAVGGFFTYNHFSESAFTKTSLLRLNLPVGGELENIVKIVNNDKETHMFKAYLNNFRDNGIIFLQEEEFSLEKGESKNLIISFKDNIGEPNIYLEKLIIESEVSKEEIPIILGIEDPNHAFAIIKSSVPKYDNVYLGGKLGVEIKVYDLVKNRNERI